MLKVLKKPKLKFILPAVIVSVLVIFIVALSVSGKWSDSKLATEETTKHPEESQQIIAEIESTISESSKTETIDTETTMNEPATTEPLSTEVVTTQQLIAEAQTTEMQVTEPPTTEPVTTAPYIAPPVSETGKYIIAIDAGHQAKGNSEKEPIGPGAAEMKAKVSSGTSGVVTGIPEYQLTLTVAQKLKNILEQRGYQVIMIRETHDVNISNAERAAIANNAGAHVFIRIHADGLDNPSVHGMSALCQSASNPYNGNIASYSYKLSECIINSMAAETGAKNRGVKENDVMSGINWAQVPVTIVEMGFMTNAEEDMLMSTEDYQNKLAIGMANGIDAYFFQ